MADIRTDIYDGSTAFATSGAPTWPPAWQANGIDDVTYHHETLASASLGFDILTQYYTGSPQPPTPGLGGYYWVQVWFMWKIDDGSMNTPATPIGPGDISGAMLHFVIESYQIKDSAPLDFYFVPRFADPPGTYGSISPPSNAVSQRDWELSDGTFITSETNPFYTGEHIVDLSSAAADMATAGEFSIVVRLSDSVTPSADPTSTYEYLHHLWNIGSPNKQWLILSTGPPPGPNTDLTRTDLTSSGLSDCQARYLPELAQCVDAELQRRRWPTWALRCDVTKEQWMTTREGDIISTLVTSQGLRPQWILARVISREFSERDGHYWISLQRLRPPDGRGRRFNASRNTPTFNPPILDDPIGQLLAQQQITQYLLHRQS